MINYIKSNKIEVFPSGFRIADYAKSKHTTEENLLKLNILSNNTENNIFTLAGSPSESIQEYILYIKGYYFKITGDESIIPTSDDEEDKSVYACIKLRDITNVGKVLSRWDDETGEPILDVNDDFEGLYFTTDPTDAYSYIKVRDAEGKLIYQDLKFNANEIRDNVSNKKITDEFNTEKIIVDDLTINEKINNLIISGDNDKIDIQSGENTYLKIKENTTVDINKNIDINSNVNISSEDNSSLNINFIDNCSYTLNVIEEGEFNLPNNVNNDEDYDYGNYALIQKYNSSEISNDWELISSNNTSNKESIVLRDENGNTELDKLDVNSIDVSSINLTDAINGVKIESADYVQITNDTNGIKIAGKLEVTSDGDLIVGNGSDENPELEIKTGTSIQAPLRVAENINTDINYGCIIQKTGQNDEKGLYWTSNDNTELDLHLPCDIAENSTENIYQVLVQKRDDNKNLESTWLSTTNSVAEDIQNANKILMTDSTGKISGTISGVVDEANKVKQTQITTEEGIKNLLIGDLTGNTGESGTPRNVLYSSKLKYDIINNQLLLLSDSGEGSVKGSLSFGSGNKIDGNNYTGISAKAKILVDSEDEEYNVGSNDQPIYFQDGIPTIGKKYAGGTNVKVNGNSKSENDVNIYCPTSHGTSNNNQLVVGDTTGATWLATNIGDTTTPIYIANGVPTALSYSIQSNVPQNAVFTDTDEKVKVTQASTSLSTDLPLLVSSEASPGSAAKSAYYVSSLKINPNTGKLQCNTFKSTGQADVGALNASSLTVSGTTSLNSLNVSSNLNVTGSCSANYFNATSDKRLKENIVKYTSEKSILDLPVYKYDFIKGKKNQIGCLAQDLQEICPEIVNENEDGYLSIQESKLVYLLLEEVKILKKEVEELKK